MKKTYCATRLPSGCEIVVMDDNGKRKLDPRLDLWNHSPDGFEWGYHGSGPSQTALAILADATGDDDRSVRLHQEFKRQKISWIRTDSWSMTDDEVMSAIKEIEG